MKNIVICCDGTRGKYDRPEKNTNVVRLFEQLKPDSVDQVCYYDPGIGTQRRLRSNWFLWVKNLVASASGYGLRLNVVEAYKYLMNNYEEGDRVFLFGYSRGAHTVRALAGLLCRCGLIRKGSEDLVVHAINIHYGRDDEAADGFKRTFSRDCYPYFIGVWDTVASVGWLWWRKYFRNARLDRRIPLAYQALSVDERRAHFRPSIWDESNLPEGQTIEQVWFPGYHADIGGQNVPDRGVSDLTLIWMMERAESAGLCFRQDWQKGLKPSPHGKIKQSRVWQWWLLPRQMRIIPDPAQVHPSVFDRINDGRILYQPKNVPGARP